MTARAAEASVNTELGAALGNRHPRWGVRAEQYGLIADDRLARLDLLIEPHGVGLIHLPAETKFVSSAGSAERDAAGRLGKRLTTSGSDIRRALAVQLPDHLGSLSGQQLRDGVEDRSCTFGWCLLSQDAGGGAGASPGFERWPELGWIEGNVDELARFCELVLIDDTGLEQAAADFDTTVSALTRGLRSDPLDQAQCPKMAAAMSLQDDDEQTTKTALTMIANAFVFERSIQGTVNPSTGAPLPVNRRTDTQAAVLANWDAILRYNYWPIFEIAKSVMRAIRTVTAQQTVIPQLVDLADRLSRFGATATGDIAGQLFGKLITDRKMLATFYTLPSSAYLMGELTAARLEGQRMLPAGAEDPRLADLRVADLACGTGALLTALYQRIAARIRSAGNDDAKPHTQMIEDVIWAADIYPAAAHLTATLLASAHPSKNFKRSRVMLLPYGPRGNDVGVGSLELIDEEHATRNLLEPAAAIGGVGIGSQEQIRRTADDKIPHNVFHAVVMNPPFSSNTSDQRSASKQPMPAYAGLGNNRQVQKAMSGRAKKLTDRYGRRLGKKVPGLKKAHNGNASEATAFIDLADAKLDGDGFLGLILPQTILSGSSWLNARTLIETLYDDIVAITIAATGSEDRAFSADTGMAECMLVARRTGPRREPCRVTHVSLAHRPASMVEGVEMARAVSAIDVQHPQRSGQLMLGGEKLGEWTIGQRLAEGNASVEDHRVSEFARELSAGRLAPLRIAVPVQLPITTLGKLGQRGPVARDIGNEAGNQSARGPLEIFSPPDGRLSWQQFSYPVLWTHKDDAYDDREHEQQMEVLPDRDGHPKTGRQQDAAVLFSDSASRLHFNLDFRLNSQQLAACLTPNRSLGGRAWPTVKLEQDRWQYAAVLWHNTTCGLILWWLIASRQQEGRAVLTGSQRDDLPTLDCRALSDAQHQKAKQIFDRFKHRALKPAHEAHRDWMRKALDHAVLSDLLGVSWQTISGPLDTIRRQWCAEPTVHGGQQ